MTISKMYGTAVKKISLHYRDFLSAAAIFLPECNSQNIIFYLKKQTLHLKILKPCLLLISCKVNGVISNRISSWERAIKNFGRC